MTKVELSKITGLSDVVFKAIMYTKENVLVKVLETLFEEEIGEIHYLSPEIPVKKFIEKGKRLDLYLEKTDSYVDIEVTNDYGVFIVNRNLGYGFQIYCDVVRRSDKYDMYKKVRAIHIIGNKKSEKKIRNYYFKDENGKVLSDMLLYSEIYIDNFIKLYYNKDEQKIEKYKYIIMLGLNLEELEKFNSEYGDEIVSEYKKKFEEVVTLKEFEPWISKEEDEIRIRNSKFAEGVEFGIEQGVEQRNVEIAKNLLSDELSFEYISKITGLSIEEIKKLKD